MRYIVLDGFYPWVRGGCLACSRGSGWIPMRWRCALKQSCPSHSRSSATALLLGQSVTMDRIGIRPEPLLHACSLREPMDRNHLGQCTALSNKTECERYWEARTKVMENIDFVILLLLSFCDYPLALGLCIHPEYFFFLFSCFLKCIFLFFRSYFHWSHRSMIDSQCTCH